MRLANCNPPKGFGPYYVADPATRYNQHMFVCILPLEVIDLLVLAARYESAQKRPNPHDNRGDRLLYVPTTREQVNFIRHCLINRTRYDSSPRGHQNGYDNMLFGLKNMVWMWQPGSLI